MSWYIYLLEMFRKLMFFSQIIQEAGRKKYFVKKIRFLSSAEYWVLALLFLISKSLEISLFLKAYDLPFLFPEKNLSLILDMTHADLVFAKIGS